MEDFNPIAARVNAVKDADVVFMLNGSPVAVGLVAKGLRSLGNNTPVVHSGVPSCQTIMDISGKDVANDIISMSITPHAKGNPALLDEIYDKQERRAESEFLCPCPELALGTYASNPGGEQLRPGGGEGQVGDHGQGRLSVRDLHLRRRREPMG